MKKKLLFLFLVSVLILSAFSMTAYAAEIEVDTIVVENLHAPFAGDTPDYDIDLPHSGLVLKQSVNHSDFEKEGTFVNGVAWYEVQQTSAGSEPTYRVMHNYETFELGKKYCVKIFVMPVTTSYRQFVFADSVKSKIYEMASDTEGMTNYKTGTVITPTGNKNTEYKVVECTYECTRKSIVAVEITGLKIPKAGEYPDNDCNVLTEGVYTTGEVIWVHKTGEDAYGNGHYEAWGYDKPFVSGETYKYSIWLRTDFVNGYWFRTDVNGENVADIMVNGIVMGDENICDTRDVNYVRGIEYEYCVAPNLITNIDIVGLANPVAGMQPDFEAFPKAAGYDITDIFWVDQTLLESVIASGKHYAEAINKVKLTKDNGKTFTAGHIYRVCIEVEQQQNYEIAYDPSDEDILCYNATVNGKDAAESSGRRGEKASFTYSFGEPLLQLISKIDITGVDAPVAGNVPDYDAVCGDDSYSIVNMFWIDETAKADLIASGMLPAQAANQCKLIKGDGKTFKADRKYKVVFEVKPGENYEIDYDEMDFLYFSSTVNGFYAVSDNSAYRHYNAGVSYEFDHTCDFKSTLIVSATPTQDGTILDKCSCGAIKADSTKTVYKASDITLSKTSYTYNGKEQKPTVTVKDSNGNVINKENYTVKYESGRKNPGKYTVKIIFKGNYEGEKKLTYTIAPKATSKISASQSTKAIKLSWKKVTGADGYAVYQYKSGEWKKIKTVKTTSYKVEDLKAGTKYKFKVKAYKKDDGTIWGKASDTFETATKCKTPSIAKLTTTKGKASFTWSDVSGESGYQVYYSTKKDSGFKKVASYKADVTKGSKSKLTSGKTYYFKVRAYTKTDSGTVYSAWSSVKSIKIK